MWRRLRTHATLYVAGVVFFAMAIIVSIGFLSPHAPRATSILCVTVASLSLSPLIVCAYRHGRRHQRAGDVEPTTQNGEGFVHRDITGGDYDWNRLIDVYLLATGEHIHKDIENYYRELLAHLESLFGIRVVPPKEEADTLGVRSVFVMLMRSTIRSYHASTTPTAGYLESGLLIVKLQESGDDGRRILSLMEQIGENHRDSRAAHLELIRALFKLIHGEPRKVVTSAELRDHGFDDSSPPNVSDYLEYM